MNDIKQKMKMKMGNIEHEEFGIQLYGGRAFP